jgi:AcrR family transcriptional regulator
MARAASDSGTTPRDDGSPRLPPGLAILWGRRPAPTRGPRAELDVDRIVGAAVEIANAQGLEAVSMARVAERLGFTTMSLYRHVASKDELLALMWNASARTMHEAVIEGAGWRERLTSWALLQRRVIGENIWITQLPMARPPLSPDSLAWVELALDILAETGLPVPTQLRAVGHLSQMALMDARMAFEEERGRLAAAAAGTESDYLALVRELADPATYPRLHALATQAAAAPGAASGTAPDPMQEYRLDLDLVLDGIEAAIARAAASRSPG